jgi:multiple sugar transport system substrate-binding protein
MTNITRRDSLVLGAAALGAAAVPIGGAQAAITDVPVENVTPPSYKIEAGATLRVLRPAKFVDPDEKYFRANTEKFIKATGIKVQLSFVSWEDLRPQTAVAANTGAGPDVILGWYSDPQIYASKVLDVTDLASYLGQKYGGWYQLAETYGKQWGKSNWLSIPFGGSSGPFVYRKSWLNEAGYQKVPDDLNQFLTMAEKLQKNGHPVGFALGHAVGDANGFVNWLLWSHNAALLDPAGKVMLDSQETIAALKYVKELYPLMIPGTLAWSDPSNNKIYAAGGISLTQNGVSIYYALKNSPDKTLQAIAADTYHQLPSYGLAKQPPEACLVINAMVMKHTKYPNAAKEYLRFMMEKDQYAEWLQACYGYWSNSLKNYSKMEFWTADPKLIPYAAAMGTPYYDCYQGPITAKTSAIGANYTVVDMFASVASGNATPEAAAKQAAHQAESFLKG